MENGEHWGGEDNLGQGSHRRFSKEAFQQGLRMEGASLRRGAQGKTFQVEGTATRMCRVQTEAIMSGGAKGAHMAGQFQEPEGAPF